MTTNSPVNETEENRDSFFDVCVICDEPEIIGRVTSVCEEFNFTLKIWPSFEAFLEAGTGQFKLVVASLNDFNTSAAAAELAQGIRHMVGEHGFVICCLSKTVDKDAAVFVKKSGANLILIREEIFTTSKLEFIALQTVRSTFLPVKASDVGANATLPFSLYHLLARRGKFVKFVPAGGALTEKKFAKLKEIGEIYIHRNDADSFRDFIKLTSDKSAAALARRCRTQYLALHASFLSLILLITDQSESGSFAEGQRLLKVCQSMCDELLGLLAEKGDAWEVINNSAIGEMGSIERGPVLAAYAGLLGLQMELSNLNEIMLAALLADLGLILMTPAIAKNLRKDQPTKLKGDDEQLFKNYPNLSLELCLSRKLPLGEKFRHILVSTNERADGTGFPKGINQDKIVIGSQLIQFCRDLDRRTVLKLGHSRPNRAEVMKQMLGENSDSYQRYNKEFMQQLQKITT